MASTCASPGPFTRPRRLRGRRRPSGSLLRSVQDVELLDALRTTGSIREFTDEVVDRSTLARILDTARFAPNGGNAQAWKVVVVEDMAKRERLRDIYLVGWRLYLAQAAAGLRPWAPVTDRALENQVVAAARAGGPPMPAGEFAENLHEVPALLVVLADLRRVAAIDRDLDRYTFVGGASIYPFVWSILLAARAEGIGGVITTMPVYDEASVKELFDVPDEFAVAATVALGHPVRRPTRLRRDAVETFATVDAFGGRPLSGE